MDLRCRSQFETLFYDHKVSKHSSMVPKTMIVSKMNRWMDMSEIPTPAVDGWTVVVWMVVVWVDGCRIDRSLMVNFVVVVRNF